MICLRSQRENKTKHPSNIRAWPPSSHCFSEDFSARPPVGEQQKSQGPQRDDPSAGGISAKSVASLGKLETKEIGFYNLRCNKRQKKGTKVNHLSYNPKNKNNIILTLKMPPKELLKENVKPPPLDQPSKLRASGWVTLSQLPEFLTPLGLAHGGHAGRRRPLGGPGALKAGAHTFGGGS